jgi:hypothetical protein
MKSRGSRFEKVGGYYAIDPEIEEIYLENDRILSLGHLPSVNYSQTTNFLKRLNQKTKI